MQISVYAASGYAISILSGRLSFMLGLTGPNFPVDTACSATLAALHCTASATRLGECERASVCGLGILEALGSLGIAAAGMTSPRGRCHTFDSRADGFTRAEGAGAFILETRDTEIDKLCHMLGSSVQQDGPSASLTAPNGSS